MAIFSYDDIVKKSENTEFKDRKKVSYLNSFLKTSGSKVIVRFPYTSTKEFDFVSIHKTQVGDKFRNIFCLRSNPKEPLDNCPLCSGKKLSNGEPYESPKTRFFVKLIAYIKDENGKVTVTPCIWEQSAFSKGGPSRVVRLLADLINEYGSLKEVPCQISRSGEGLSTEYDIRPVNPVVYNAEMFPIDFSAFENFTLKGIGYTERSFEDLKTLVETGDFPTTQVENNTYTFVVKDASDTQQYTGTWPTQSQVQEEEVKEVASQAPEVRVSTTQTSEVRPARMPRQY